MAFARITREERIGLGVAAVAHVALAWVLMTREEPVPVPEIKPKPVVVTLSTDVGLTSTAPDPVPEAAMAPPSSSNLPDTPPASVPDSFTPAPLPTPTPAARPSPAPTSRATRRPPPTPTPTSRASSRTPTPRSTPTPSSRASRSAPTPTPSSRRETGFDGAFGNGSGTSQSSSNSGTQAAEIGPAVRNSLAAEITRQLRPHWSAPQGVDVELLVTRVRFSLNRDGSLSGSPRCISTTGVNASNSAQKDVHCERAIRAVRAASPFNLPAQYHEAWKTNTWSFDRNL